MSARNCRKVQVLQALEELGNATAEEVLNVLADGLKIVNIRMRLFNYRIQGLVYLTERKRPFTYSLTNKGMERLSFLRDNKGTFLK